MRFARAGDELKGKLMLRIRGLAIIGRMLFNAVVVSIAFGAMVQATWAATETDAVAAADVQETSPASVTGFRTATFGMDEAAVFTAISNDFGIAKEGVKETENTVERTRLLTVSVPDLLEGGGVAQVSYIFGYKSKTLIQVGASWNMTTDPEMTDKLLVANGDVLTSHFLADGFDPASVTAGTAVGNGILLFRGGDADGHTAILLLQGSFEQDTNGQNALKPTGLALLYSVNPDAPDIFRIKDGNF